MKRPPYFVRSSYAIWNYDTTVSVCYNSVTETRIVGYRSTLLLVAPSTSNTTRNLYNSTCSHFKYPDYWKSNPHRQKLISKNNTMIWELVLVLVLLGTVLQLL